MLGNQELSNTHIESLFDEIDTDDSGTIDIMEFMSAFSVIREPDEGVINIENDI